MINYSYSCFTFFPNYTLFCVNNTLRKASEFSTILQLYFNSVSNNCNMDLKAEEGLQRAFPSR